MAERRKSKELRLAYLLCWLTFFSDRLDWEVSRECLLESGTRKSVWLRRKVKGEVLHGSLEMGSQRWGRPQQVICC